MQLLDTACSPLGVMLKHPNISSTRKLAPCFLMIVSSPSLDMAWHPLIHKLSNLWTMREMNVSQYNDTVMILSFGTDRAGQTV